MLISPQHVRAELVRISKYARPLDDRSFESYEQSINRVVYEHQKWLWERAAGRELNKQELDELANLAVSMKSREQCCSGRTLWLGGTPLSKEIEVTQFNCAYTGVRNVRDVVDFYWLLLNGSGVGAKPGLGLTGFNRPIELELIRSQRTEKGGEEDNKEIYDEDKKKWEIVVGDSAPAWAKVVGKIVAHPHACARKLILDFSQIRPAGIRLSRYGWISSGDKKLVEACEAIVNILNRRCGDLLTKIDVLDILNWIGTTLSSRRSAEIMLMDFDDPEWYSFATAKKNTDKDEFKHRGQSNNSTLFYRAPSHQELTNFFEVMLDCGGSEPGMINAVEATRRAAWFEGVNP